MNWILPGFPTSNPILSGLASVADGGDVEQALLQRDALLDQPEKFMAAAWEALAWLPPDSPLASDLVEQGGRVWAQLSQDQRADLACAWAEAEEVGPHQAQAIERWGEAC